MALPIPYCMRDTEPLLLKFGPKIDFAERANALREQEIADTKEEEKRKQYDPWFTVPGFELDQMVWAWLPCHSKIEGRTRVRDGKNEFAYCAYVEEIDTENKTCGLMLSESYVPGVPWELIVRTNPHNPPDTAGSDTAIRGAKRAVKKPKQKSAERALEKVETSSMKADISKCEDCGNARNFCECELLG